MERYLNDLDYAERARVIDKIAELEEQGRDILKRGHDHADYLRDDIYELRARYLRKRHRILFFFFHRGKVVLTSALLKKSGPVADSHIKRAIEYRQDYLSRH